MGEEELGKEEKRRFSPPPTPPLLIHLGGKTCFLSFSSKGRRENREEEGRKERGADRE